ncbi:MAG: Prolipoprotein diacylglyceryl transferase [Verrucomicrobiota bacterium]
MHPVLFEYGGFALRSFGVCAALGLLVGTWIASRRCINYKLDNDKVQDIIIWSMLGAVIGARAYYVIRNWDTEFTLKPLWKIFAIWEGGIVFYGGLFGGLLTAWWLCRRAKIPFLHGIDLIVPSLAIAQGIGRIGCYLNGCCFGSICNPQFPLGVHYPVLSDPGAHQVRQGLIAPDATQTLAIHPSQLYEAAFLFAIGLLAWLLWRQPARVAGRCFGFYAIGYAIWRFCQEFLRDDTPRHAFAGLNLNAAQFTCLPLIAFGLWLVLRRGPAQESSENVP